MSGVVAQVYLVPGFFGFTQLGGLRYFLRVADVLGDELARLGCPAEIIEVDTKATSSIRRRALALCQDVEAHGGLEHDRLHFVGHSTGGLDVRLALTPGVQLDPGPIEDELAARTRSAISLSTPHFGTPLANVASSLQGRNLLYLLTLMATSKAGRAGISRVARMLAALARFDDRFGMRDTLLDDFAHRLLDDLGRDEQHALFEQLAEVRSDQGAMVQLTPEAIDLFNAAVPDREGIAYASYVTAAPKPRRPRLSRDVYSAFSRLLYTASYTLASKEHRHYPYPSPAHALASEIRQALPFELDAGTNDGIVPTLSQVWAELGGVVVGDHLDVVGQYPHARGDERFSGWMDSGAGFDDARFESLWRSIAARIAAANG